MNLYESIKNNLKEDDTLYNNPENTNDIDKSNLTFDDIYISCRLTGQNKGLLGVAYVKDPSDDKIYNVEVSYIDGEYRATSGLYPSERLVNLMKSIYGEHIENFAKDVVKKEGIELKESEKLNEEFYDWNYNSISKEPDEEKEYQEVKKELEKKKYYNKSIKDFKKGYLDAAGLKEDLLYRSEGFIHNNEKYINRYIDELTNSNKKVNEVENDKEE